MNKSYMIDKTTKLVLKWGYTDLTQCAGYDSNLHDIIQNDSVLTPDIDTKNWYWNTATQQFQDTQP